MISELHIKNFKCFGNELVTIPLERLTMIFGANSAGKSTMLQALRLLGLSWERFEDIRQLRLDHPELGLGTFKNVVHNHEPSEIQIGVSIGGGRTLFTWTEGTDNPDQAILRDVDVDGLELERVGDRQSGWHVYGGSLARLLPEGTSDELREWVCKRLTASVTGAPLTWRVGFDVLPLNPQQREEEGIEAFAERERTELAANNNLQAAWFARQDSLLTRVQAKLKYLASVREQVRHVFYLGPLRHRGDRWYASEPARLDYVGWDGSELGHLEDELIALEVNRLLHLMGLRYVIRGRLVGDTARLVEVTLHKCLENREVEDETGVGLPDVGSGIRQVLPVLVQIAIFLTTPTPDVFGPVPILIVEQPELHLHPGLQIELMEVLLDGASILHGPDIGVTVPQVLAETHSEHMVLRWQRKIRGLAAVPPGLLVLGFKRSHSGNTPQPVVFDASGDYREWPEGFFEDRLNEVLA